MTGNIPPGNAPGETRWQARRVAPLKKEIRLTAGKPISGITMEQLIDRVVKDNKVGKGRLSLWAWLMLRMYVC